jgi:hypothetical protein
VRNRGVRNYDQGSTGATGFYRRYTAFFFFLPARLTSYGRTNNMPLQLRSLKLDDSCEKKRGALWQRPVCRRLCSDQAPTTHAFKRHNGRKVPVLTHGGWPVWLRKPSSKIVNVVNFVNCKTEVQWGRPTVPSCKLKSDVIKGPSVAVIVTVV